MKQKLLILIFFLCQSTSLLAQIDFRKETIYFLMPTRFYDGDPSNNVPTEWCSYFPGNPNNANYSGPEDVTWRGDFKGLIQKLDYIKDLGFTAIWITPVVQNRGPLDYHGYHAWDFTKVDPRHESVGSTFKDLIDAAHAKGIKVVLDIVTNHSGRFGIKGQSELKYNTDPTQPWGKNSAGTTLLDNPNWQYDGITPNPDDGKIWSRANIAKMPAPYNQNLALYNWPSTESFKNTSDPNWFHQWGNGFVQGWDDTDNSYNGAIAGDCPDLNTSSQTVQDYFFNAYKQYIDWGVDAFRWDTYKHMSKEDIQGLLDRFLAYKPDLFVFGEVAQKRHELHSVTELNPHWYTWRGAVGSSASSGASVIDFYGNATFHNIFQDGGGFKGVEAAARYDNLYSDPSKLVTWLDNHDFGPNNDWNMRYSGTNENLAACMNFMFLWRGIPAVYYGTEMRFMSGAYTDLHDAAGINKSLNETGRAYYGDVMSQAPNHVIYKHIKKLNAIRKAIPALQNGTWSWAGNAPGNGVGFTRKSGSSEVAVGLAKDGNASFSFTGLTNGVYRDAVTGREFTVSNGNLNFTVTSGSAGIYALNGPGMIGENGVGFFETCANGCTAPVTGSILPASGNYSGSVSVTISAAGGTAPYSIRYTTDGTTPTTSSTVYSSPFSVTTRTIVKVLITDANGKTYTDGQQYTFELAKPTANISPASGNYYDPINVTLSATQGTAPYTIYYTQDGSTPTISSTVYSAAIAVSTPKTIKVLVKDANNQLSTIASAAYTFTIPDPTVSANPTSKNISSPPQLVTLTATTPRTPATIYYTTDGSTPTQSSSVYSSPISVTGTSGQTYTLKFFAKDSEGRVSAIQTETYTFNPIPEITVYFKKPSSWANAPKIHYWNGIPAATLTPTTWPGVAMTLHCGDWYKFTFNNITSCNIIFNNGSGGIGSNQTPDLVATTTGYYDGASSMSATSITAGTPACSSCTTPTQVPSISPSSISITSGNSTTLSASGCGSGQTYLWNTGAVTSSISVTPSTTSTYFVKCVDGTCQGSNSTNATVTVNSVSCTNPTEVPSISPTSSTIVMGASVTLTATGCGSGQSVKWSTNDIGNTLTISPNTSTTYNYTAKCVSGTCEGTSSTAATVTVTSPAGITVYFKKPSSWAAGITPKIYAWTGTSTPQAGVWPGTSMTLHCGEWYSYTFSSLSQVNVIFNNGSGGTGNQSADLSATQNSYYDGSVSMSASSLVAGLPLCPCTPPTETPNITPTSITINSGQNATLVASDCAAGQTYKWESGQTTTSISVSPTSTSSYKAKCVSADGCEGTFSAPAVVTIAGTDLTVYFKRPTSWTTTPKVYAWTGSGSSVVQYTGAWPGTNMIAYCDGWYSYTFTGTSSKNVIFNNGTGGGTNQTPDLIATQTSKYDGTVSMTATTLVAGEPTCPCTPPAAPTVSASPSTVVSGATSTLTAIGCVGTVSWFDVATGGTPLATGATYTTPALLANKTYYAECAASVSCISATRGAVTVTVTVCTPPAAPTVSASPSTILSGATSTLTATGCTGTVSWFDVATGGTALATGTTYTTVALTANKTYYAECAASVGCVSATRGSVTVTVSTCGSTNINLVSTANDIASGIVKKETDGAITATNKIIGTSINAKYDAKKSITLDAGFEVRATGANVFQAYIDGCGNN